MILVAIGFLLGLAAGMLAGHYLTLHRRRSALDAVVEAIEVVPCASITYRENYHD